MPNLTRWKLTSQGIKNAHVSLYSKWIIQVGKIFPNDGEFEGIIYDKNPAEFILIRTAKVQGETAPLFPFFKVQFLSQGKMKNVKTKMNQ